MKKIYNILKAGLAISLVLSVSMASAQTDEEMKYRRSSLYSLMIQHDQQKFAQDISNVFRAMPVPDKYNNHDLSVKVVSFSDKKLEDTEAITHFLDQNDVASRLVGKWFDRDILTGACDMELIKDRGVYNASEFDKALAKRSARGLAMLQDAGEDLIGNTFVLVNDIRYIDKSKKSGVWGAILSVGSMAAAIATNNSDIANLGSSVGSVIESYKGFKVKINTYLYQLVWDDNVANDFYTNLYSDKADDAMRKAFEKSRTKFRLKYIGMQESSGSTTSFLGIKEDEPLLMVRKACQRALDENVANLQKNFDQFKVRVPLLDVKPLKAQIGMKEGIDEDSQFEVLEATTDKKGLTVYKRVGVIKPMKNRVWDNRFMAKEEHAFGADLNYTTFKKVSGGDFYPGMLIREIK